MGSSLGWPGILDTESLGSCLSPGGLGWQARCPPCQGSQHFASFLTLFIFMCRFGGWVGIFMQIFAGLLDFSLLVVSFLPGLSPLPWASVYRL